MVFTSKLFLLSQQDGSVYGWLHLFPIDKNSYLENFLQK